jgi:hypothetical protein
MGLSNDKANNVWLDIWEKSSQEFVAWLADSEDIPQEQRKRVAEKFAAFDRSRENSVLSLALQSLEEPYLGTAIDKYADLLLTNLDSFYTSSFDRLTVDQKQAVSSFLSIAHE